MKNGRQNLFMQSLRSVSNVKNAALCAMLLALCVASEFVAITTPVLKITFSFIFYGAAGMLFGPVVGFFFGAANDILGYLVNPSGGMYYPLFTVVAAISGMMYGLVLYRGDVKTLTEPISLWRVIIAQAVNNFICNLVLNTACVSLLLGKAYIALLPMRLLKNFILLPFEIIVLAFILAFFGGALNGRLKKRRKKSDDTE